jgi:hypothetical protein
MNGIAQHPSVQPLKALQPWKTTACFADVDFDFVLGVEPNGRWN